MISVWVRRIQEHMRILNSKKFPSDLSLASNSSSTSAWSGHSSRTHQPGHIGLLGHHNSGHTLAGHATPGGGAFQFMEPWPGSACPNQQWVLITCSSRIFIIVDTSKSVYARVQMGCLFKIHFIQFVYFYETILLIDSLLVCTTVSNSLQIFFI